VSKLKITETDSSVHLSKELPVTGRSAVVLNPTDERQLLDVLAKRHGMMLATEEELRRALPRPKPVAAAVRVARYLEGRRAHPGIDQELIHGVGVFQEDDTRDLNVSDLQALLDYIREA
jgi:hypothetical protein